MLVTKPGSSLTSKYSNKTCARLIMLHLGKELTLCRGLCQSCKSLSALLFKDRKIIQHFNWRLREHFNLYHFP